MFFSGILFRVIQYLWKCGILLIKKALHEMITILFIYSKSVARIQNLIRNQMGLTLYTEIFRFIQSEETSIKSLFFSTIMHFIFVNILL